MFSDYLKAIAWWDANGFHHRPMDTVADTLTFFL
jgi:hypothetical protein